jgi:Zn-dependent M28 family amino/carboxypeptidase
VAERKANVHARDLLLRLLRSFGYNPVLQGSYDNIVATTASAADGPFLLLGAHYDSVPDCPGADDNASAVAVCLECARLLQANEIGSTMIVLFNREEDGMLGSQEFVAHLAAQSAWAVEEAHIFEMVGFCDRAAGSQRMPPGLPGVVAPDVGDFLGLLANRHSNTVAENLLTLAATYVPQFPVLALKIYLGIEKHFRHLLRSDHAPFWEARIPSLMWTDTSEFRNPHYHRASDTPDTLDYDFLTKVTQLALARAVSRA